MSQRDTLFGHPSTDDQELQNAFRRNSRGSSTNNVQSTRRSSLPTVTQRPSSPYLPMPKPEMPSKQGKQGQQPQQFTEQHPPAPRSALSTQKAQTQDQQEPSQVEESPSEQQLKSTAVPPVKAQEVLTEPPPSSGIPTPKRTEDQGAVLLSITEYQRLLHLAAEDHLDVTKQHTNTTNAGAQQQPPHQQQPTQNNYQQPYQPSYNDGSEQWQCQPHPIQREYTMYRRPSKPLNNNYQYPPQQHFATNDVNQYQNPWETYQPPPQYHQEPINNPQNTSRNNNTFRRSSISSQQSMDSIDRSQLTRKERRKMWFSDYLHNNPDEQKAFLAKMEEKKLNKRQQQKQVAHGDEQKDNHGGKSNAKERRQSVSLDEEDDFVIF